MNPKTRKIRKYARRQAIDRMLWRNIASVFRFQVTAYSDMSVTWAYSPKQEPKG